MVARTPLEQSMAALGGMLLVVHALLSLGLPESVRGQLRVKEREWSYDEATYVARAGFGVAFQAGELVIVGHIGPGHHALGTKAG